jgi:hemin uptake protein HemP
MNAPFPTPETRRPTLRRPAPEAAQPPVHDARALTEGGVEARILLDGAVYTLRITRLGKLILTK